MNKIETISLGRSKIGLIEGKTAESNKLCLNDILTILRKNHYLENGKVEEYCPSAIQNGDRIFAPIPEIRKLVLSIRKSKHQKGPIRNVIQLLNSLTASMLPATVSKKATPDDVIPVMYNGRKFQAKTINGRLMFNVTEMAKDLDKQAPFVWLNLASTKTLMQSIVSGGKAPDTNCLSITYTGRGGSTWLDSTLLIEYGRFLSPEFGIWCDGILMKLFSEGYVSINDIVPGKSKRIEQYLQNYLPPSTMDEALVLCEEQHTIIQESQLKVEYYDNQVEQREWFPNSFIANELDISIRALNLFLEDEGVQTKRNGKWELTDEFRGIPLKTDVYYDNNPNLRCVWTHYGRDYIHELWMLRNGI